MPLPIVTLPHYKQETIHAYDTYARALDVVYAENFKAYIQPHADHFLEHIPGKDLLDIGSGPGHAARYFQEKGMHVLCIDYSEQMIALCREKGLEAQCMDIENITLPENSYNGVWACASLLNLPKTNLPQALAQIHRVLKPEGIAYIILKEGEGEGFETDPNYPNAQRYASYYSDDEMRALLEPQFTFMHFFRTWQKNGMVFINYLIKNTAKTTEQKL